MVSLFNPRQERWADHFAWSTDSLGIIGLTPTSRATIALLHLNRQGLRNLRHVLRVVYQQNNAYGYVDDSNRQQFTGHERDEETGLDYTPARHYGSALGRFISVDAVGGRGTDPQTLNLYAYVNNNPLRYRTCLQLGNSA